MTASSSWDCNGAVCRFRGMKRTTTRHLTATNCDAASSKRASNWSIEYQEISGKHRSHLGLIVEYPQTKKSRHDQERRRRDNKLTLCTSCGFQTGDRVSTSGWAGCQLKKAEHEIFFFFLARWNCFYCCCWGNHSVKTSATMGSLRYLLRHGNQH